MTPDHVRGRLSSDAGATSSSIIWPIVPSPIPTLSNAPSLTLSPTSTTNDKPIHRPFAGDLLREFYMTIIPYADCKQISSGIPHRAPKVNRQRILQRALLRCPADAQTAACRLPGAGIAPARRSGDPVGRGERHE